MSLNERPVARHVTVVVADENKLRELQRKRDADPDRKLPELTAGYFAISQLGETYFEILADGETAGYLVERKVDGPEIYKLFVFSEFRCRGIAKKAVYSWRLRRLKKGLTHVQLEVDCESVGFWASVFPRHPFDYFGVHPEVRMDIDDKEGSNRYG